MLENKVPRKTFGPKRKEVMECWRRLYKKKFIDCAFPAYYTIKSRRMRWEGHVEYLQGKRNAFGVSAGKSKGKKPFRRISLNMRIILKKILK
jgi:hypothetical protein